MVTDTLYALFTYFQFPMGVSSNVGESGYPTTWSPLFKSMRNWAPCPVASIYTGLITLLAFHCPSNSDTISATGNISVGMLYSPLEYLKSS